MQKFIVLTIVSLMIAFCANISRAADSMEDLNKLLEAYYFLDNQNINSVTCHITDSSIDPIKLLEPFRPIQNNLRIDENLQDFTLTYGKYKGVSFKLPHFRLTAINPKELDAKQNKSIEESVKDTEELIGHTKQMLEEVFSDLSRPKYQNKTDIKHFEMIKSKSTITVRYDTSGSSTIETYSFDSSHAHSKSEKSSKLTISFGDDDKIDDEIIENGYSGIVENNFKYKEIQGKYIMDKMISCVTPEINGKREDEFIDEFSISYQELAHILFPSKIDKQAILPNKIEINDTKPADVHQIITLSNCKVEYRPGDGGFAYPVFQKAIPEIQTNYAWNVERTPLEKRCLLASQEVGSEQLRVDACIAALKDENTFVRRRAVVALGEIKNPRAVEPLIDALKDEDPGVRINAAVALRDIKDARAVEALIAALKDEYAFVRRRAAVALGEIKDARAVEPLIAALVDEDENAGVRMNAAVALGMTKDTRVVEPLISALKDKDPDVRREAARALMETKDACAIEPLIVALKDEDIYVRRQAVGALGMIKDTRAVEPLIAALKDKDGFMRGGAAWALGEIKDARAVEPLVAALKSTIVGVRSLTAWALGEIKDGRAVEPLIVALKDEHKDIREYAVVALYKIKDARAVEPLIAALKDKDEVVRRGAALFFWEIKDTRAVEPLIAALKDKDEKLRRAAAYALGEIKDVRAVTVLLSALEDKNLDIIIAAHKYFIRRGKPGTEKLLIEALNKCAHCRVMAEDFLNCGNSKLEEAAKRWVKDHSYTSSHPPIEGKYPIWGREK